MSNTPKKQDDNNNNMESSDSIFSEQANKMQAFFEQKIKVQEEKIKEFENSLKSKVLINYIDAKFFFYQ